MKDWQMHCENREKEVSTNHNDRENDCLNNVFYIYIYILCQDVHILV